MKRVGIMTFHNTDNYGAELQAYALQEKINRILNDADVRIIDYRNKNLEKNYKLFSIRGENLKLKLRSIISNVIYFNKNLKRRLNFKSFRKNKFKLSNKYKNLKQLEHRYPKYDIYVTGSDQVWNYKIVGDLSNAYTLNFGDKGIKRISYAASIGLNKIEDIYKKEYYNKIKEIDRISVREENAREMLNEIIKEEIEVVLDPTLLLTKKEWNNEIIKKEKPKEKYILAYVVAPDKEYTKIVNELSRKTGLKVIHFEKKDVYENTLKSLYTQGPLDFINYIKNAEYVVATSFHAAVFSIIFNKKFFIVPHKNTSSRVTNLLTKLEISDRIFYSSEEFKNIDYNFQTDWKKVESILNDEREKSINWLKNALEG